MNPNPERIPAFVAFLESLASPKNPQGRQALAALRRILTCWPAPPPQAIRIIAPWLPANCFNERESVYYLIGGLFALHPLGTRPASPWGESLGKALRLAGAEQKSAAGAERRLLALLNAAFEDLPDHLRHVVSYLKSKDIPIDYRRLMADLEQWPLHHPDVCKRWGRDYWSVPPKPADDQLSETQEGTL